jgi:hypothetical protein
MHNTFPSIIFHNTVTCRPTARQRVAKHIPAEANAWSNRTSTVRQRHAKDALSTIQAAFRGVRAKWL